MRGRPNDPVRAKAKASAHAKHSHTCPCGRVVFGNGGWASHKRACKVYQEKAADREIRRAFEQPHYFARGEPPKPKATKPHKLDLPVRLLVEDPPAPASYQPSANVRAWLRLRSRFYVAASGQHVPEPPDRDLNRHLGRLYGGTCRDHGEYDGFTCPGGYDWRGQRPGHEARWEDCGKPELVEVSTRDVLRLLRSLSTPTIAYLFSSTPTIAYLFRRS